MRTALLSLLLSIVATMGYSGENGKISISDLLPANSIFCLVPPETGSAERDYTGSLFQRLGDMPEMAAFLESVEQSRRELAADIAQTAQVGMGLAEELVNSKLGIGLINVGIGRDGQPTAEFVITLTIQSQPDRNTVFSAVMALLNRPEVVRSVLESQGMDPNLPLKTLAQEETLSGYPPILRIGPNIRVASLGNTIILYHGPGSEGIKKIFDSVSSPSANLTNNPAFQAVYHGAQTGPGMSFAFVNVPRILSVLDALNVEYAIRTANALGLATVQAIGLSGGWHGEGVRHSMFVLTPPGQHSGLMASLAALPGNSQVGMEGFANIIPASAEAFLSVRVDLPAFIREVTYFLDSVGAVTRPGGLGGMLASETVLGVPLMQIIQTLGTDIIVRPHDDTQVALFHNVDVPAFESLLAQMEHNSGERFRALNIGGYQVRYFNRRASLSAPLAPAFCLIPRQDGSNRGILYAASHPQALVSLIQETAAAREPIAHGQDFQRATAGLGSNYSLFYYNDNRDCYRRVYNFLLPVASLWSSSSRYPVDTGLLPPASSIIPGMFGFSLGIQSRHDGLVVQAYSPVGASALPVILVDKLVVSNPLVIGYVYALIEEWIAALPDAQ